MSLALQKFARETTAHGILHLTGERRIYVKVVWLVTVLLSLSYCTYQIYAEAFQRYASGEFSTTTKANELDFEFPDLYMCNEFPISGSFSVTLTNTDEAVLRKHKQLVNRSLDSLVFARDYKRHELYAKKLVNTLPFQFLSDKMANQKNLSVFEFYFNGNDEAKVVTFHHPYFVNCIKINFSNEEIGRLQNPSTYFHISLFTDPELPPSFVTSAEEVISINGNRVTLKPRSWDSNFGIDSMRPSGFRIFMTPRGHYPSELDASITAGPGLFHKVIIKMQDVAYNIKHSEGKCRRETDGTADFVNPYSLEKQTFKHSQAVCWYLEVARLSRKTYNCIVWRLPLPWEFRSLPSCFNLTEFHGNISVSDTERHEILQKAKASCRNSAPCRLRSYSFGYSSSTWPSDETSLNLARAYASDRGGSLNSSPGFKFLLNSSFQQAKESLLQIELSAASFKSEEIKVSLAYDFNSLIADVGGLIGLFLGTSMMSVLELVELLHDCILVEWLHSRRRTAPAREQRTAPAREQRTAPARGRRTAPARGRRTAPARGRRTARAARLHPMVE